MILLIVGVTVAATVLLVGSVSVLVARRQPALERRLAGYDRSEPAAAAEGMSTAPETAVVQHAVDLTGRIAQRYGLLARTEQMLEQADLPIHASELLFYIPVFAVLAFLLLTILVGPLIGLVAAVAVGLVPLLYISHKQRNRTAAFERQLPDTLTLLASSLRAGFSLMQGLESVSQEVGQPTRNELQRVFTEVRLGRGVEDALGDAAERMQSSDLAWSVQAIKIQREVGGNLATLLDTVADTMKKREQLRREIQTLTAEGRLSAWVLSLMPPALGLMLYIIQPDYVKSLFHNGYGVASVIAAVVLSVIGWFWLRRIMDIEV